MTKSKITKRALLSSVMALLLCVSMMLGTTFAWFTDEVTSEGNIIQSGTLDVEMSWNEDNGQNWTDASEGAIFNYQHWEPGYTDIKYVKIANVGSLAFKYQLNIVPNITVPEGEVNLADVIDVYLIPMTDGAASITRETISALTPVGTLSGLMTDPDGAAYGVMLPTEENQAPDFELNEADKDIAVKGSATYCIVLKMQETAGNEYQNLSVGEGFKVQLLATQYTWEKDSIDNMYDEDAGYDQAPVADVTKDEPTAVTATWGIGGSAAKLELNPVFSFKPTETYEEAQESPYRYYHADFVVYADKNVAAEALALAGYYNEWCQHNNDNWVALKSDAVIPANEKIRLVDVMGGGDGSGNGSISVNYEELCQYGNDGIGFRCGAAALDESVIGTTLTVELRLYETTGDPTTTTGSKNIETGEYIVIGTYSHTF